MTPKTLIACLITLIFSTAQVAAQVATKKFGSIFTLGDSLTDHGNLFKLIGMPKPPYWQGRFSNGPVWAEQLATALEVNASEFHGFAVGGATTTDVTNQQVKALLAANNNRLPADGLYLYWAGANDLLMLMSSQNGNPETTIMIAMGQTASALSSLLLAGAKTIVVVGLPDLSKTPRVVALKDRCDVADMDRILEQDEYAGDEVLDQGLGAEADRKTGDAGTGQQRADIDPELGERHHRRHQGDHHQ